MDNDILVQRIFTRFDTFESKIDDLCTRITTLEANWHNHIDEIKSSQEGKEKKFYVLIALIAVGFSVYEIIKGGLIG